MEGTVLDNIVEVKGLTKYYRDKLAVNNVNFHIQKGIIFGLLGTNGAGKSTIIKMLTGQLLPSEGFMKVCGINPVNTPKALAVKIGVVPEQLSLYLDMSVYNNLKFFAKLYNIDCKEVDRVLELLELNEYKHYKIKKLSKGYKQRVLIARSLLHDPQLIFMDEPTSGLDPHIALELRNIILKLKEDGKSIVLTTHDMNEAEELCEEVLIISKGNIVLNDSLNRIKYQNNRKMLNIETIDKKYQLDFSELHKLAEIPEDTIISIHSNVSTLHDTFLKSTDG